MKLSLRGEYALRALIELAEAKENEIVPIQLISTRQQIPKRFLEQILNDLRSGDFVESKRGIAGGYRLARPAQEVSLSEVIQHIEGVFQTSAQAGTQQPRLQPGALEAQKAILNVMKEAQAAATVVLEAITLQDLLERTHQLRNLDQSADYAI